jgi:C-8 sterol isomerase
MAYAFDPEILHACAREGVGLPLEAAFDAITAAVRAKYPAHVPERARDWIFNNAGGAMGQITVLHSSVTEYLLLFGTPIGTEGHSGRYRTEVWDFVFDGEMWCYLEGETARTVYRPGDAAYLGPSAVKGYRVPDRAWMLEYARGPIATMLPFGLADTAFSTLDHRAIRRTLWTYGKLTVGSLLRGKI